MSPVPAVQAPEFLADDVQPEVPPTKEEQEASDLMGSTRVYVAFLAVGCSCGWLLINNMFTSFGANYASVQESNFYGAVALIQGAISIALSMLFVLMAALRPRGLSRRSAQLAVGVLCMLTIIGQVILARWWSVQDDEGNFPVLLMVFALGIVVATLTYFVAFPLITAHYGGWLVAPFRAGTDSSLLVCALLSEAQAPRGGAGPHLFPAWTLQVGYAVLAALGLASWVGIVKTGAGLRKEEPKQPTEPEEPNLKTEAPRAKPDSLGAATARAGLAGLLETLHCPASLVGPVLLGGMMSQVNYWALAVPIGNSSARMTDPLSCDGDQASALFKAATTAGFCLVPFMSLLSSVRRCPRPLFYALFLLQCLCVVALWLSLFGVGREAFWQTEVGGVIWGVAYSLTGGLEGYLLTMTYRYVGDDPGVAKPARASASSLVSFLGVLVTNAISLGVGIYMLHGGLACVEP